MPFRTIAIQFTYFDWRLKIKDKHEFCDDNEGITI